VDGGFIYKKTFSFPRIWLCPYYYSIIISEIMYISASYEKSVQNWDFLKEKRSKICNKAKKKWEGPGSE
jgi:hypothetical protein